jgi:hypothetical protein
MKSIFEIERDSFIVVNPAELAHMLQEVHTPDATSDDSFIDLVDVEQDNESVCANLNWKSLLDNKHRKVLLQQNAYLIKNTLLKARLPPQTSSQQHEICLSPLFFDSKGPKILKKVPF